jgi:hypothetical protein
LWLDSYRRLCRLRYSLGRVGGLLKALEGLNLGGRCCLILDNSGIIVRRDILKITTE